MFQQSLLSINKGNFSLYLITKEKNGFMFQLRIS